MMVSRDQLPMSHDRIITSRDFTMIVIRGSSFCFVWDFFRVVFSRQKMVGMLFLFCFVLGGGASSYYHVSGWKNNFYQPREILRIG